MRRPAELEQNLATARAACRRVLETDVKAFNELTRGRIKVILK